MFISPIAARYVTQGWGFPRSNNRTHEGLDFRASIGTPVLAAAAGVVVISQDTGSGTGKWVAIRHADGFGTRYMHLNERLVKVGDYVRQGQVIGRSGDTASEGKPHLHFDMQIEESKLAQYLGRTNGITGKKQAPLGITVPGEPFVPGLTFADAQLAMMKKFGLKPLGGSWTALIAFAIGIWLLVRPRR